MLRTNLKDMISNGINNPRRVMDAMKALGLIDYEKSKDSFLITMKNILQNDWNNNPYNYKYVGGYEYLHEFFTTKEFMDLEVAIQKILLLIQTKKYRIRMEKYNVFNRKDLMKSLNISNITRFNKYFDKAIELLRLNVEKKKIISYSNHRQNINFTYKISIGEFLSSYEDSYEEQKAAENKEMKEIDVMYDKELLDDYIASTLPKKKYNLIENKKRIKRDFILNYIEKTLAKNYDGYTFKGGEKEKNKWLWFFCTYGQVSFFNLVQTVVYHDGINDLVDYFAAVADDKFEYLKHIG